MVVSLAATVWDHDVQRLLYLPAILSAISAAVLVIRLSVTHKKPSPATSRSNPEEVTGPGPPKHDRLQAWVEDHDGLSCCAYKTTQLAGILALVIVTATTLAQRNSDSHDIDRNIQLALLATYVSTHQVRILFAHDFVRSYIRAHSDSSPLLATRQSETLLRVMFL